MERLHTGSLRLPSFLQGTRTAVGRKVRAEGRRCAKHYQAHGVLPQPRELLGVEAGEVVFILSHADLEPERPAWRPYLLTEWVISFCEAVDARRNVQLSSMYEEVFRQTPWGALYFATGGLAPESVGLTASRLGAVLHSWDSLQHGRYLFRKANTFLDLEGLMSAACGWALDAWCPEGGESAHASRGPRFEWPRRRGRTVWKPFCAGCPKFSLSSRAASSSTPKS